MKNNFEACVKKVFEYEGGYTNDPDDPGGPTNWGITINDARMYWKKDATAKDVKAMPKSVAYEIYRGKYWDKVRGDDLPAGYDLCVFDFGVNSGVSRALKYAQTHKTIDDYCDARLAFLKQITKGGGWAKYGKGWSSRVANVRKTAHQMEKAPLVLPTMPPKAPEKPAEELNQTATTTVATGAVIASGTAVAASSGISWWYIGAGIAAAVIVAGLIISYIKGKNT